MFEKKSSVEGVEKRARGFTLVETLVAMSLLAVGLMGLASLIPLAAQNDFRSRLDTTATFVAMRQLEQMVAQPYTITSFTSEQDGIGATSTVALDCGTPPCAAGADLAGDRIDFSQAFAAIPDNYRRLYTLAPSDDPNTPKVNGGLYEIRWNITENANRVRTIIIAARTTDRNPGAIAVPANLRVVRMR